jgi:AraC-like DNA-binding protein
MGQYKKALEKWSVKKATQATDHILYEQRETLFERLPYRSEKKAFGFIRDGETEKLLSFLSELSRKDVFVGNFSDDELRQEKYLAVSFIALAARAAIEGGVPEAEAYCLNDELIQRVDKMKRVSDVRALIYRAMIQMTQRARRNHQNRRIRTAAIETCINYIDAHLHYGISLGDLSRACGLSPSHLSRLFKRETGLTPTAYIRKHRLFEARDLLLENRLGSSAIANVLGFSSQSYFIACFKDEFGVTPGEFARMKK